MASLLMHLIIGENYKNNIDNFEDFIKGNLAPDLVADKSTSHYSAKQNTNYIEQLKNKVNLNKYCQEHTINTDYDKGFFLHLLTDYIFYKLYLANTPPLLEVFKTNPANLNSILYSDYDNIVPDLLNQYSPRNISIIPSKFLNNHNPTPLQIVNVDIVHTIINFCTSIDLDQEYLHIKQHNAPSFDLK